MDKHTLAFISIIGLTAAVSHAKDDDKWVKLGSRSVEYKTDHDTIEGCLTILDAAQSAEDVRDVPAERVGERLRAERDPRHLLVDWMATKDNKFFAPALVNRYAFPRAAPVTYLSVHSTIHRSTVPSTLLQQPTGRPLPVAADPRGDEAES
jgi:hypothetical protein